MMGDEQPTCEKCGRYNFACQCNNCGKCEHWDGKKWMGVCRNKDSGNYKLHMLFDAYCAKFKRRVWKR